MNKDKIIIRPVEKGDLKSLASLYAEVYTKIDIGEIWTPKKALCLMDYQFTKQSDLFFVALVDKKVVGGFMANMKPWWDGNHLVDGEVFVAFKYQKQKIGTRLSQAMYKEALDKYDIVSIDFITFSKNGFPLGWYERLGFETEKQFILINGKPKKTLEELEK